VPGYIGWLIRIVLTSGSRTENLWFSPADELRTVSETIMKNMQQMQGA
jgi:hypothetical protein